MRWIAFIALLGLTACPDARPDDEFEPDNTPEQANRLTTDAPIEGRSNQHDPDVFALALTTGQTAIVRFDHRAYERCPRFEVISPDIVKLYADQHYYCSGNGAAGPLAHHESVTFEADVAGYEITVLAEQDGDYYFVVEETSQADNIAPFSWDYTVSATIEGP